MQSYIHTHTHTHIAYIHSYIHTYVYIYIYQHCTDEAQKAETVLSAVSYIYIYAHVRNIMPLPKTICTKNIFQMKVNFT